MHNKAIILFTILTFSCLSSFAQKKKAFIITQSMIYKDSVDLSEFGVPRNPIIYFNKLKDFMEKDGPPPEPVIKKIADKLQIGPLPTVIDIEKWNIYTKDKEERKENLRKLIFVIESLRKARPDLQYGYYGVVPQKAYWQIVDPNKQVELYEWQSLNKAAKNDFVPHIDAIFPSLYTNYNDPEKWKIFAIKTLIEAKGFNKPVYAFLWPRFHDSNQKLKGQYMDVDYWRMELETCLKYCDGVVIWNSERKMNWDPNAPWWKETLKFINKTNRK